MSDLVTWFELLAWAKFHGAKNEKISSIRIDGLNPHFVVIMEGIEVDDEGRNFLAGRNEVGRWQSSSPLKKLP